MINLDSLTFDFSVPQNLSSALSVFSVYLPRFIQTITSLKTTGIPESIPVSIKQICLLASFYFFGMNHELTRSSNVHAASGRSKCSHLLSYRETNSELGCLLVSHVQMNIWKNIYLNCGQRYEFMFDHPSYTHNLSSCKIKAWKKFRPEWNLSPWTLWYWYSALPTELSSRLGAGHSMNL